MKLILNFMNIQVIDRSSGHCVFADYDDKLNNPLSGTICTFISNSFFWITTIIEKNFQSLHSTICTRSLEYVKKMIMIKEKDEREMRSTTYLIYIDSTKKIISGIRYIFSI